MGWLQCERSGTLASMAWFSHKVLTASKTIQAAAITGTGAGLMNERVEWKFEKRQMNKATSVIVMERKMRLKRRKRRRRRNIVKVARC